MKSISRQIKAFNKIRTRNFQTSSINLEEDGKKKTVFKPQKKRAAIILCGAGYLDGNCPFETVALSVGLDRYEDVELEFFAPEEEIDLTFNYGTKEGDAREERWMHKESARIVGNVSNLAGCDPREFDTVILPGGLGNIANLSTLQAEGTDFAEINDDVERVLLEFHENKKLIAGLGESSILILQALQDKDCEPVLTLGSALPEEYKEAFNVWGGKHKEASQPSTVFDEDNLILTNSSQVTKFKTPVVTLNVWDNVLGFTSTIYTHLKKAKPDIEVVVEESEE